MVTKNLLVCFVFVIAGCVVHAEVLTGTDDLAQLPYWELRSKAMTFRLVQRLPDQTRAYFSGRGFSKEDAEYVAGYCVFQTVFTNTAYMASQHVIQYDASKWLVLYKDKQQSLVLREDWRPLWQRRRAKKPQRIAFEWSLLPTRQQYQPSDYNWGMTVFKLPHGSMFDLKLFWTLDGVMQNATIKDLQCAKDIYIPPVAQ
ncbi:MAG: hypothetical protein KAU29_08480 [Gammaproteobacteria bacterium]|nr:hypothetical protein [Gammaproteobacteria bacterium]